MGEVGRSHKVQNTGEVVDELFVSHNLESLTLISLLEDHGVSGEDVEGIITVDSEDDVLVVSGGVFRAGVDDIYWKFEMKGFGNILRGTSSKETKNNSVFPKKSNW